MPDQHDQFRHRQKPRLVINPEDVFACIFLALAVLSGYVAISEHSWGAATYCGLWAFGAAYMKWPQS